MEFFIFELLSSAAEVAGLKIHDKILQVNGVDYVSLCVKIIIFSKSNSFKDNDHSWSGCQIPEERPHIGHFGHPDENILNLSVKYFCLQKSFLLPSFSNFCIICSFQ